MNLRSPYPPRAARPRQPGVIAGLFAVTAVLAVAVWPLPATALTCRKTPTGACIRWYESTIHWTTYVPAAAAVGTASGVTDAAFVADAKAAVAAWQGQVCSLCSAPGLAGTCVAQACDPNPLGVTFVYGGAVDDSRLATDCKALAADKATYSAKGCPAAAAGSAQVALIRAGADWPLSANVVSGTVITSDKAGRLIDADMLVRDNGSVFCTGKCTTEQYLLRSVMLQEVGHMLGVGFTDGSIAHLAANLKPSTGVAPTISSDQTEEACTLYRTSEIPDICGVPVADPVVVGCDAGAQRTAVTAPFAVLALLATAVMGFAAIRRRRRPVLADTRAD